MNTEIILCGCKGDTFYIVFRHTEENGNRYYSFYTENGKPSGIFEDEIIKFMEENADYGGSVAGNYEQVLEELMEFLGGEKTW